MDMQQWQHSWHPHLVQEKIIWIETTQTAFESVKQAMTFLPVLAFSDFTMPFIVETDTSDLAISAVLMQYSHSISSFSKKTNPTIEGNRCGPKMADVLSRKSSTEESTEKRTFKTSNNKTNTY